MMNPAIIMKLMNARSKFQNAHPKFASFLETMMRKGVQEGTIIEITVTGPEGNSITGNMRVTASDMELIQDLRDISLNQ